MRKVTTRVGTTLSMTVLLATAGLATHANANADPGAHKVRYTVTTTSGLNASIYAMTAQPASKAAYDADSAPYLTSIRVEVNPGAPWVLETTLDDPDQWALVTASGGLRVNPEFHCEIAVDDQVVVSNNGGSGVQCALPGSAI